MEAPSVIYDQECMGDKLRELRKKNKITQAKMAEKLNVSVETIQNYEKGRTALPHGCITQLCQEFHVSADYFFFGCDNPLPQKFNYENDEDKDIDELLKNKISQHDIFEKKKILMMINIMFQERPAI